MPVATVSPTWDELDRAVRRPGGRHQAAICRRPHDTARVAEHRPPYLRAVERRAAGALLPSRRHELRVDRPTTRALSRPTGTPRSRAGAPGEVIDQVEEGHDARQAGKITAVTAS